MVTPGGNDAVVRLPPKVQPGEPVRADHHNALIASCAALLREMRARTPQASADIGWRRGPGGMTAWLQRKPGRPPGATHPWRVTLGYDGEDWTARVAARSQLYEGLDTAADTANALTGYASAAGAEIEDVEAGDYVVLALTLDSGLGITAKALTTHALSGLDGNYYSTVTGPPDYIGTQYLPVAAIESDGAGGLQVRQIVRDHIRLGITVRDGFPAYAAFGA